MTLDIWRLLDTYLSPKTSLTFIQLVLVGSKRPLNVTVSSICGDRAPVTFNTGIFSVTPAVKKQVNMSNFILTIQNTIKHTICWTAWRCSGNIQICPFYVSIDKHCQVNRVYWTLKIWLVNLWKLLFKFKMTVTVNDMLWMNSNQPEPNPSYAPRDYGQNDATSSILTHPVSCLCYANCGHSSVDIPILSSRQQLNCNLSGKGHQPK